MHISMAAVKGRSVALKRGRAICLVVICAMVARMWFRDFGQSDRSMVLRHLCLLEIWDEEVGLSGALLDLYMRNIYRPFTGYEDVFVSVDAFDNRNPAIVFVRYEASSDRASAQVDGIRYFIVQRPKKRILLLRRREPAYYDVYVVPTPRDFWSGGELADAVEICKNSHSTMRGMRRIGSVR